MKQGFFDLGTGDTPDTIRTQSSGKRQGCEACELYRDCKSPKMEVSGKGKLKILIVGEAPGKNEDEQGIQFVGKSGEFLEDALEDLGIDMRRDCRITNSVCCRPIENKTPGDSQINECRPRVLREISEFKPDVIIPLGTCAVQSIIGHKLSGRFTNLKNTAFYGEQIPDQDYGCWICPTYHPAHFLYENNKKDKVKLRMWKKDLEKAIEIARNDTEFPKIEPKKHVLYTDNIETATKWLHHILNDETKVVVYDYETTGIKPHREGHKIVCASICTGKTSYAFPFFDDVNFKTLWQRVMTHSELKKIAHKIDFENTWTYVRALKRWPGPYEWDTCLAAHCINNKKPVNLKFLTYVNFGIIGYDDEIDKYIRGVRPGEDRKSANHFNMIHEAPMDELLKYCAFDSYFGFILYEKQKELLKGHQLEGFKFFLKGAEVLSRVQDQGIKIDVEWMNRQVKMLTKKMDLAEKEIIECEEVSKWDHSKEFNFLSNAQLSKLLYNILKYKKPKEGGVTDEEALNKIGTDFTKKLLTFKKLKKIRDTYLSQYSREEVNGVIRPFYNISSGAGNNPGPRTFRSSSNCPNFHNVPKRNKEAMQIVRSIIKPSPGNRLISRDYKGVEVSVSACYHKDPTMIKYILDPSTDMHRDQAMELFFRNVDDFTKQERYLGKNGFVFPEFYGSSCFPFGDEKIGKVTQNIWDAIKPETFEHLAKNGIKNIEQFQEHVEEIETRFWNEKFPVYKEWKLKTYEEYQKNGYVDLYTGFRCYGPMKFTEVTNYPIQGSAFHCLLWNLIHVQDPIKKISGRSSVIGQIHDDIVGDVHPDDENEFDRLINLWGTKKIREHWDWIIVPLKIEKERSEIDGSWDSMEECEMEEI